MTSPTIDWSPFVELVRAHQRFVLTSHVRPDCDALGSELGLAGVLESLGKQVRIVNADETPPNLAFIDPGKKLLRLDADVAQSDLDDAEVLIVLDTSAWAQLGGMAKVVRETPAKKLVVDHHKSEDDLGAQPFKNVAAEATGRLVCEAGEALGVAITPEIAMPLFAALATDTGWFRFASTTSGTYDLAGRLIAAGARPDAIYQSLYEQDSLARLKLRGRILSRAQTELDGRLIHTAVLLEDFAGTGALPSDTEDAINLTLCVAGVEVAVILVAQQAGGFKISFRSRGPVDCSRLAEQFNGGGHKAAAGASIEGPLETAQAKVLKAVRAAMG